MADNDHSHEDGPAHANEDTLVTSTEATLSPDESDISGVFSNHAGHARWLVHAADYAVFSMYSTMQEGWPFSSVVSISDGPAGNATGRIIVYVTTVSQFAADVAAESKVSLGLSQAQADGGTGCQYVDAEWPLCARVGTLSGTFSTLACHERVACALP